MKLPNLVPTLLVALLVPLCSGCAALFGAATGAVLSSEVGDNSTYVVHLNVDSERTWATAKTTLSYQSLKPIQVNDEMRTIEAEVDGAVVTVGVETYDLEESVLRVQAKKFGMNSGQIAQMVKDRIVSELKG